MAGSPWSLRKPGCRRATVSLDPRSLQRETALEGGGREGKILTKSKEKKSHEKRKEKTQTSKRYIRS